MPTSPIYIANFTSPYLSLIKPATNRKKYLQFSCFNTIEREREGERWGGEGIGRERKGEKKRKRMSEFKNSYIFALLEIKLLLYVQLTMSVCIYYAEKYGPRTNAGVLNAGVDKYKSGHPTYFRPYFRFFNT